jgi:hypothetical protein
LLQHYPSFAWLPDLCRRDLADYLVHDIVESIRSMEARCQKWGIKAKVKTDAEKRTEQTKAEEEKKETGGEAVDPSQHVIVSDLEGNVNTGEALIHEIEHHGSHHQTTKHGKARAHGKRDPATKRVVQTIC